MWKDYIFFTILSVCPNVTLKLTIFSAYVQPQITISAKILKKMAFENFNKCLQF